MSVDKHVTPEACAVGAVVMKIETGCNLVLQLANEHR